MKISIYVGPWFPVPAVSGGSVHRFWQGIAENLASKGHKITILSKLWVNQPSHEVLAKVEYIRIRGFAQSKFLLFNIIKDFIYSFYFANKLPDADILIVNDLCFPFFAKENNGKLIININRMPKGQLKLYPKRAQFIAASCLIKNAIENDPTIDFSRVKVIPNPISVETFSPKLREKGTNKVILYVGRIHPEKGLLILIKAFRVIWNKFPNTSLRIVGPYGTKHGGSGKRYLNYLKDQCKGLNVEFIEPIFDVDKLANIYREADVFCYPSVAEKGEAFGVSALEAMASGLVTVVSDLDCFKDFIENCKTGYIFNHRLKDPDIELSKVLEVALCDCEANRAIIKHAVIKASNFSYDRVANSYLEYFGNLLK